MTFATVWRLVQIKRIVGRYRLHQLLPRQHAGFLYVLMWLNPWCWFAKRGLSRGERVREALVSLGPIFVKFGQALSTRRDFIPEDIANELAKLQDQVPPFPGSQAQAMLEQAYAQPIAQVFAEFSTQALASASIAQVHAVTLHDGCDAIVKILRPNIEALIRKDLRVLFFVARLLELFYSQAPRLRPREVVQEFENTIIDELDLRREAASAAQLRRNFADAKMIYVPQVYWPYLRKNILVMERIYGVPIADIAQLKGAGTNMKKLAEDGVEIFFTQVFRDSFFHADMHPGNIFVDITDPQNPCYKAIDFGIMGALDSADQRYLAENLMAFFNRDYKRVAELHIESGWVPADTRVTQFEAAIRTVCEPIFELPLAEISFARVLLQLFQTARRFQMPIQPQLMLLQKTLFNIEGLGRQLYPELNLWDTAKPFLQNWLKQQIGPRAFMQRVRQNMPYWLEKFPEIPDLVYRHLKYIDQMQRQLPPTPLPKQKPRLGRYALRISAVVLLSASVFHVIVHSMDKPQTSVLLGMLGLGLLTSVLAWR